MRHHLSALLFFSLLAACALHAQPDPKGTKRLADQAYAAGKYQDALQNYLAYQSHDPNDQETRFRIGVCFFETNKVADARRNFNALLEGGKYNNPLLYYYLGLTAHSTLQFLDAIQYYKTYLKRIDSNNPRRAMVKDQIRRCAFGIRIQQVKSSIIVENMGLGVNSTGNDFRPIPSPNQDNRIYFSSSREGNTGGRRDDQGRDSGKEGHFTADMFSTTHREGKWEAPVPMSFMLNSPRNEALQDFNNDGSVLFYFQGLALFSGDILVDTFRTRPEERSIFSPLFAGPVRPWEGDCDLHFFQDTILLFSSQRPGGYGGFDLYISIFSRGFWTEPENLGPAINTAYDERAPFLAIDGRTLYFSTNHPLRSIGGFDVLSVFYDDGSEKWMDPWNLGPPLNSAEDDLHFRLSKDGLKAYFSSNRKTGFGQDDLYIAYFRESRREQTRTMTPIVFSQVRDFKLQFALRMGMVDDPAAYFPEDRIEKYFLDHLYYEPNGEALSPRNLKTLGIVSDIMSRYPQIEIILTSHSDGTDPENVDLRFSMQRAEAVLDFLTRSGVNAGRIAIKGVGKTYPKALSMANGAPNLSGQAANRRIDITFLNTGGLPLRIRMKEPVVPEPMVSQSWDFFAKSIQGLSYKLQVASSAQMYSNELLLRYPNAMIEKEGTSGEYLYSVGLYKTYKSASQLGQDLIRNGATETRVVPYINGIRIDDEQAQRLLSEYPDLENYLQQ
jgi:outer membrane protein OmpA-like peptidoglycan-associated protein